METGWLCPRCGAVWAPTTARCWSPSCTSGVASTTNDEYTFCMTCGQPREYPPTTGCPPGSHFGSFLAQVKETDLDEGLH